MNGAEITVNILFQRMSKSWIFLLSVYGEEEKMHSSGMQQLPTVKMLYGSHLSVRVKKNEAPWFC